MITSFEKNVRSVYPLKEDVVALGDKGLAELIKFLTTNYTLVDSKHNPVSVQFLLDELQYAAIKAQIS